MPSLPNWSDPLPVLPVNNGDPPKQGCTLEKTLPASGKRRATPHVVGPIIYGRLPYDPVYIPHRPEKARDIPRIGRRPVDC